MRVNKTNFHMKGFALGLALKQKQNTTREITCYMYCKETFALSKK